MTMSTHVWDTGERVAPEQHNTLYLELLSAYELAKRLMPRGLVLDIGCGVGYGANHLAAKGRQIIGVDYESVVATVAARRFHRPGVSFACMDATRLGFLKASVDFVCAFQVIEHLHNQERFVQELARVLRPSGFALISTPNALVHLGPRNPFHVHEFTPAALKELLGQYFPHVVLAGQRRPVEVYSLETACAGVRRWDVLGLKRFVPRRLVSLMVYAIARWNGLTPPQRMSFDRFPVSPDTDNAYSLFALCGHTLPPRMEWASGGTP